MAQATSHEAGAAPAALPLWSAYVQSWAVPIAQLHQSVANWMLWPLGGFNALGMPVRSATEGVPQPTTAVFSTADLPFAPFWHLAGWPRIETRIEPASSDRPLAELTLVGAPAGVPRPGPAAEFAAVTALAPRQFDARPAEVDPLRYIYGVGPALEKLLNKLGIYQFRQVARWTKEDIAFFDDQLESFKGRIERDHWIRSAIEEHYKKYGEWLGSGKPRITLPDTDH